MTHLFRPSDGPEAPISPSWTWKFHRWPWPAGDLLLKVAGLFHVLLQRGYVGRALLLLALVVQGVELLVIGYLIDLALSLVELWADLAQKHLEITL